MATKPTAAPQVPGETQDAAVGDSGQASAVPAAGAVTLSAEQFSSLMARLNAVEGRNTAERSDPTANLPDADSIDQSTLKAPILTKTGWIVPDTFGANPAHKGK